MNVLAIKDINNTNLSNLSESERHEVMELKNSIDLTHENILGFSRETTQKISDFSSELLETVKLKDLPDVDSIIFNLMGEINSVDTKKLTEKKQSFFKRLLKVDDVKHFITQYESVDDVLNDVVKRLDEAEYQLKKDIDICDLHLEKNFEYIRELDKHILAAKLKSQEERTNLEKERIDIDEGDDLKVHEYSLKEGEVDRLDKKIHDLIIMRTIATQNIPQIKLIRDGDSVLIEKIETSLASVIPLWKSQIAIAIQIMREQNGLKLAKGMSDTTNELIKRNAEMLKQNSIGIAKELERDIVDFETLKKSNECLISTLKEINQIREDGKKQREKVIVEITNLHQQLNTTLIGQNRLKG